MKRLFCLLITLLLLTAVCVPVFAVTSQVVDEAGVLDEDQIEKLESQLAKVSQKQKMDLVVLVVSSLEGKTPEDYAVDYYDARYGDDGAMMLVALQSRDWYFLSAGKCKSRIPSSAFEGDFLETLGEGDYYEAFAMFASICDQKMDGYVPFVIIVSLLIGAVIGLIAVMVMKSKHKSVRSQAGADQYVDSGRLQLTRESDIFLYQTVTRVQKPQNDSGGSRGSSGRSYGGGGGKF